MNERRLPRLAVVGGVFPFFDTSLGDVLAVFVLSPLFGSAGAHSLMLVTTYAARVLGALLFGHLGDGTGRVRALALSIVLAAGATVLTALVPGHASVGALATWGAGALRFVHEVGIGGVWAGAALLAFEGVEPGHVAKHGRLVLLGAPLGFVLALVVASLHGADWNLRLFLLASAPFVLLALPHRDAPRELRPGPRAPVAQLFASHGRALMVGSVVATGAFALLSTAQSMGLGAARGGLWMGVIAASFLALGIVAGAALTDRRGPPAVLRVCFVLIVVVGLLLPLALQLARGVGGHGGGGFILLYVLGGPPLALLLGFTYAPLIAFLPALFPKPVRYTGVALSWALGALLASVLLPRLTGMFVPLGDPWQAAWLPLAGALAFVALLFAREAEEPAWHAVGDASA